MADIEITFHNKTEIRTQAQIYTGLTLVSTCVAGPGDTCVLPGALGPYDIFLKNGVTGWELARKLDSEDKTVTLTRRQGRYIITANEND